MTPLFADENVRFPLVEAIRALGLVVISAEESGRANQLIPDPEVLAHAISLGRAVLTNNRWDYHRLHKTCPGHAGIVTYTRDPDDSALALRIHKAITDNEPLAGKLVKIIRPP